MGILPSCFYLSVGMALLAELRQTTMTTVWIAEVLNPGVLQTLWRAHWKNGKKR
jgi:hypothetical protein